jgi:hypothetical protein
MICELCEPFDLKPTGVFVDLELSERLVYQNIYLSKCGKYLMDVNNTNCILFNDEVENLRLNWTEFDELYVQEIKIINRELKINKLLDV